MASKRYTVLLADRTTGVVRRCTVARRPVFLTILLVLSVPILIGLGARWSAKVELGHLQTANTSLSQENASFRAMTGELAAQIASLRTTIADLSDRANLDPATLKALDQLPAVVKSRAVGGAALSSDPATRVLTAAVISPDSSFGVLKELLGSLESRLQSVRTSVEKREALAAATPSIWPAQGWLSDGYGRRRDPFTGEPDFHPALDITADRGQPVYAAAAGTVKSAAYAGAYGNLVTVDHGFGLSTRYGHLSKFAIKAGQQVERGRLLGYVGATGRATGTHLHFEVWADGTPVNPLKLLTKPAPR